MGTIEDYKNRSLLCGIRKALDILDIANDLPIQDDRLERVMEKIRAFEPICIAIAEASELIRSSRSVALGERVCRELHPDSEATQSVFLDELAEAMIRSGHARPATVDESVLALQQHSGHPLIISKVSGRYQEICASHLPTCVFWKAEKQGLHCLKRRHGTKA
ncbi:MAG: hypothetical protein HGB00_08930 [Chlorobiaceae bacterium]|nr:hypothetical protein [Chlorobiaceae bacterium]